MSKSEMTASEHENGLIHFVTSRRRDRIKALLSSPKNRKRLVGLLSHFSDFDDRWLVNIEASDHHADRLYQLLRHRKAPVSCYVISENPSIDGKTMELAAALKATIGFGFGTVVSCLPGQLVFYEGEEGGRRMILDRSR